MKKKKWSLLKKSKKEKKVDTEKFEKDIKEIDETPCDEVDIDIEKMLVI